MYDTTSIGIARYETEVSSASVFGDWVKYSVHHVDQVLFSSIESCSRARPSPISKANAVRVSLKRVITDPAGSVVELKLSLHLK